MVVEVKSYSGELDNENWAKAIARLPAAWVTYGGSKFECRETGRNRFKHDVSFAVMVACRNYRSEAAGRQGGLKDEVGTNDLSYAVLRLLTSQRFDELLDGRGLKPKSNKIILNNAVVNSQNISIMAIEFEAALDFCGLENNTFPSEDVDINDEDYVFKRHQARLSAPYPDLNTISSVITDPTNTATIENHMDMKKGQQNES